MKKTISELILEYFINNPSKEITHSPVVDWVETEYFNLHGKKPRDAWRQIRKLYEEGKLIKVKKGIYKYDPEYKSEKYSSDFPTKIKKEILKRDNYKCVICGRGKDNAVEICADHIIPKDKGGDNNIDNGQTLCSEHNLMKKNYSQTEAGKKFFIKIYEKAIKSKDEKMINFCKSVFDVYDKHGINGHIKRPN